MAFINGSEHFVTGIELVDRQHRGLVDLLNAVAPQLASGDPASCQSAEALLDRLAHYASTHFHDEEQVMRAAGIDLGYLDRHVLNHHGFVEEAARMRRQCAADGRFDGELLLRFLVNWLTFHILVEDQCLARQLRLIAAGQTPAAAARVVRDKGSDAAHAALAGTLIDLFSVVSERNRTLVRVNKELQVAQANLAELNASLERQVEERTRELTATNAELLRGQEDMRRAMEAIERTQNQLLQAEKMAAVGQLAAGAAHEITHPIRFASSNLGSLKSYVGRLFEVLDTTVPAVATLAPDRPARRAVDLARRTADLEFLRADIPDLIRESADGLARVRDIVAGLKDFAGADVSEWQDADLNHGLESTLSLLWNGLRCKAKVVRDLGELPALRCIPAQINQVFMNLLVNAGQAIESDGTIRLRTGNAERYAWVEVEDDGVGMSPEVRKRIFDPFFTTRPLGQGIGLGLSISWGIIQRHKGQISVASTTGCGARFRIRLPIDGAGPDLEVVR